VGFCVDRGDDCVRQSLRTPLIKQPERSPRSGGAASVSQSQGSVYTASLGLLAVLLFLRD
jgi:hypothetical protein